MIQFQEKAWTDGWKNTQRDRRTDGQSLFYKTLPATGGGPKCWPKYSLLTSCWAKYEFSLNFTHKNIKNGFR